MSNSVSRFIFDNASCEYTHSSYFLLAYNSDYKVNIVFDTIRDTKICVDNRITNKCLYVDLTKDQITHLLSLDCPDAFIAYALTLCPCPPETSDTAAIGGTDDVDGGIFSIVKRLKEIKEEINQLNGSAFEKSLLTDAQHYQLLDVEMFIGDFIARSVPASEGVE